MALAPALIMIAEGMAILVLVVVSAVAVAQQPELIEQLLDLSEWLQTAEPTPEMILEEFGPYLVRPSVIFSVFAFGALIVPLIEEALKPIGVWLLVGRNLTPAAGFAAGALSGAGYALFESLALTSGGEEWAVLMAARVGTSVIHILTTGMTGWALVMAWERNRYAQLGLVYLGAVLIHGAWNALTLFTTYTTLLETQGVQVEFAELQALGEAAPFALGALAVFAFLALLWANRSLAHTHWQMAGGSTQEAPANEPSGRSVL
jgi:RsiW-degrading membrane proteinase PrsW (M82 family)